MIASCAYSASFFWAAVGLGALCMVLALYEQHRSGIEEKKLRNYIRQLERERLALKLENEFMRTDPRDWRTR